MLRTTVRALRSSTRSSRPPTVRASGSTDTYSFRVEISHAEPEYTWAIEMRDPD